MRAWSRWASCLRQQPLRHLPSSKSAAAAGSQNSWWHMMHVNNQQGTVGARQGGGMFPRCRHARGWREAAGAARRLSKSDCSQIFAVQSRNRSPGPTWTRVGISSDSNHAI